MRGLRDPLSQRRIAMIQKVFAMLDKDRSAQITFSDVANIYDVSMHPDFLARKKTKDEIVREFLNSFDEQSKQYSSIINHINVKSPETILPLVIS
jgi:Ca2+-binding EF-hand superfamily protein